MELIPDIYQGVKTLQTYVRKENYNDFIYCKAPIWTKR